MEQVRGEYCEKEEDGQRKSNMDREYPTGCKSAAQPKQKPNHCSHLLKSKRPTENQHAEDGRGENL